METSSSSFRQSPAVEPAKKAGGNAPSKSLRCAFSLRSLRLCAQLFRRVARRGAEIAEVAKAAKRAFDRALPTLFFQAATPCKWNAAFSVLTVVASPSRITTEIP